MRMFSMVPNFLKYEKQYYAKEPNLAMFRQISKIYFQPGMIGYRILSQYTKNILSSKICMQNTIFVDLKRTFAKLQLG